MKIKFKKKGTGTKNRKATNQTHYYWGENLHFEVSIFPRQNLVSSDFDRIGIFSQSMYAKIWSLMETVLKYLSEGTVPSSPGPFLSYLYT